MANKPLSRGTLCVEKITLEKTDSRARLLFDLTENGQPKPTFFEVEEKYGEYLCHERCDAIVIGLLSHAMRNGLDIKSQVPITEELLYNLNEYLIPALTKYDAKLTPPLKIDAPTAEALPNAGAVGTGISCGVDSFHSILSHYNTPYASRNVTHLQINNVGDFAEYYREAGIEKVRDVCYERARKVAKELNLPLVETSSNLQLQFPQNQGLTATYTAMFAVLCLQKFWKTFYYASSYESKDFKLENSSNTISSHYDIFSLNCFSTDKLRIYSGGAACDRLEKVARIADNKVVQENLHVCWRESYNCGWCGKCRRTILELYALGKLENFGKLFDLNYFKKNKNRYLHWLYFMHLCGEEINEPTYQALKHEVKHKIFFGILFKIAIVVTKNETMLKMAMKIFGQRVRDKIKSTSRS